MELQLRPFAVLIAFLPVLLFPASPIQAQEAVRVTTFSEDSQVQSRLREAAARALETRIELEPVDPLLLEYLRWAIPDLEMSCSKGLPREPGKTPGTPESSGTDPSFQQSLDRATGQIDRLELDSALETLREARAALACTQTLLTRDQLRELFLLEAVTHVYKRDGLQKEAFLALLAVDSRLELPGNYPSKIRNAFLEAVGQQMKVTPVPLETNGVDERVLVDAQPIRSVQTLRPGRHLFQIRGPNGEVRTRLLEVRPAERIDGQELTGFGLPAIRVAREQLENGLRTGQLDQFQLAGLDGWLEHSALEAVAFVVESGARSQVRVVARTQGLWSGELRKARDRLPRARLATEGPGNPVLRESHNMLSLRVGGGTVKIVSQAGGPLDSSIALALERRLGKRLQIGAFTRLNYESYRAVTSPALTFGLTVAGRQALGSNLNLVGTLGALGGKGPMVDLENCSAEVELTSQTEQLVCGNAGEIHLITNLQVLGVLGRLEIVRSFGRWSVLLGGEAEYEVISQVVEGTAHFSGTTDTGIPFVYVGTGIHPLRISLHAGVSASF